MKKNECWTKPEKCVLIACFYKQNGKSNENNNVNNNRHDHFADGMELDSKCEEYPDKKQ